MDKLFNANTRTQVLKAQVFHWNQVSKTQDTSFLNSFKNVLINEIVSKIMLDGKFSLRMIVEKDGKHTMDKNGEMCHWNVPANVPMPKFTFTYTVE